MYYHVRITQKSNKMHDEVKLGLSEEMLNSQFIEPYEIGEPIIVNGKTILLADIERIKIFRSNESPDELIRTVEYEQKQSNVVVLGLSKEWKAAGKGEDITDTIIKGSSGYKKGKKMDKIEQKTNSTEKIFIVHGHDDTLKNDTEIFIKNIGLDPIVLHRQPDEGLTIIEKFEKHAEVGYALILLTPDDIAYSIEEVKKIENERQNEYRARQNVIFEFGYFLGKLGRNRVCCIYKEGTSLPTDISGVLYKKVNNSIEDIGYNLIKELQVAGYNIKLK